MFTDHYLLCRWGDVHADQRYARRSWEKFVRPDNIDNIWQW